MRGWAISYGNGSLFYVATREPLAVETVGARVWPVVGHLDGCALPMASLTGRWGGRWWFRTGPDRRAA